MERKSLVLMMCCALMVSGTACDSGGAGGGSEGGGEDASPGEDSMPGVDSIAGEDTAPGEDILPGEDTPPVTGEVYGSCDQDAQCTTYPSSYTEAERKVVFDTCPGSGGTWLAGQACPEGWFAACEDYTAGSAPASTYYYSGGLGLTETQCEGFGGSFINTLPDDPGTCWPTDGECQDWYADWDTPDSIAAACGDGTYSPDPCPMEGVMGLCTTEFLSRTFYYYASYPDIHYAETLCGNMGGVWSLP